MDFLLLNMKFSLEKVVAIYVVNTKVLQPRKPLLLWSC